MPVYQFIAENEDAPLTYYAQTNNIGNYTRNIRCEWNKKYKKLHETSPQTNIYGIIGKAFGDYEVCEMSMVLTDGKSDEPMNTKELLQFFCATDRRCLNKNKHTFNRSNYQKSYYSKKKYPSARELSPTSKLREYGLIS